MAIADRMIVPLREDEHRLRYAPGVSDVLVISFASIGQKRKLMPNDEFTRTLAAQGGAHLLFVSDKRRSWLNAPELVDDLKRTVRSLRDVDGVRRVVTMGLSMGGFSALAAAMHFEIDAALAISPQVSVHPGVMPEETRWRHWRQRIGHHLVDSLETLPERGVFTIFHGTGDDMPHVRRFPRQSNVDHFLLRGFGHAEVGQHLSKKGGLVPLLAAVIAGDREEAARLAEAAGATRR